MAPAKKKPAKKPTPRRQTVKAKFIKGLKPQLALELVAWEAYEDPKFFAKLVKNRSNRENLNMVTMEKLNPDRKKLLITDATLNRLGNKELDSLQTLLQGKMVLVDFAQVMKGLHAYTTPTKTARLKVMRQLALGIEPWAPWDPVLRTEVIDQGQKDDPQ